MTPKNIGNVIIKKMIKLPFYMTSNRKYQAKCANVHHFL